MCGQAVVGGQAIMPCPDAAKLEQDVWVLMQANQRLREALIHAWDFYGLAYEDPNDRPELQELRAQMRSALQGAMSAPRED